MQLLTLRSPREVKPSTVDENGARKEKAFFETLRRLWKVEDLRGLKVRHATGVLLNKYFGQPGKSQSYRAGILKRCSENLNIAEADLSRMRHFARRFGSIDDLNKQYPDVTNWTQVRALLVKLRAAERKQPTAGTGNHKKSETARPIKRLLRVLQAIPKYVADAGKLTPDGADWMILNKAFEGMLTAVESNLGIHYIPDPNFLMGHDNATPMTPTPETFSMVGIIADPSRERIILNE
jgi:hypothetical protein